MIDAKDSSFKSYIVDENELESINLTDNQRTKFLDGETIVCEAKRVLLYAPLTDRKKATIGILTVTTFKLSFINCEQDERNNQQIDQDLYQQNLLLGPYDVCLSSIDTIYQIGDRTKKKLLPGQNINGKIKELLIICKNMRYFELSFKLADKDVGKNITNALLHHCYPKRHSLLFAYDYKEPYIGTTLLKEVRLFRKRDDWKRELDRTKCKNWRPSVINENYQTSQTLLSTLIVPQSVTDSLLSSSIEYFRNRYCPLWVWGTINGAALVRMADLLPAVLPDRTQENILLEHIRKSHPDKKQPHIIDLMKDCPTPKDIQLSYLKLRELCIPDSIRIFKNQDFKFYGLLDSTKWLLYVSICLTKAVEAAEQINKNNCTVVLQENNGQDLNCLISSLIQLIMDPYFRTKYGFQSLIQKDWVVMGHPFAYRLGHILDKDIEQSPIFLLFLDCVWQLLQQYPQAFQISETYLTTIWDSVHISIFDTCLFNCEHDRVLAEVGTNTGHGPLILRSMWDWREQFNDKDISLFCNPLYDDSFNDILHPGTNISQLDLWLQCYFRWLPDLEIRNGGKPQIDLFNRYLVSEILKLQQHLNHHIVDEINNHDDDDDNNSRLEERNNNNNNKHECLELLKKVNSFYPFSYNNTNNNNNLYGNNSNDNNHSMIVPLSNILLTGGDLLDTQSILNLNND